MEAREKTHLNGYSRLAGILKNRLDSRKKETIALLGMKMHSLRHEDSLNWMGAETTKGRK